MADFDLTQTDQQVQNILNDGQSAMGAGAQTTLTTEYVMLKDTSGIYHKILKSSFTEAIRDVLAGLLVNNDKGTTISQIAAIASGDFGSVTPDNLASVLGGINGIGTRVSLAANEEKTITLRNGFYVVANTGGNSPKTIVAFSQDNTELLSLGNTENLDINVSTTSKHLCIRKGSGSQIIVKSTVDYSREFMYYYLGQPT